MGMNRYRNHKSLMDEDGWEWLIWPYSIAMLAATVFIIHGAANAATPVPRSGKFCPLGYYYTSAYCVPTKATKTQAFPRESDPCPLGSYIQADYCVLPELH